ncbi:hypothetical protein [Burkholderia sp. Ac-20353]|uniref:hypothetical protein n=1 Tax=Burkholderia sp. Ac-20353 TaxID=2703894 RepID=UPI00197B711B|nr:hypothetical protein [Burkholderia sp. Ac-20353]
MTLAQHACVAQRLEMMGQRRFRAIEAEPAARMIVSLGFQHQLLHDRQPQRIGQRAEYGFEAKLGDARLRQRVGQIRRRRHDAGRTFIVDSFHARKHITLYEFFRTKL